jgi:uncharacterized repeat protein (TIGR03847 family)
MSDVELSPEVFTTDYAGEPGRREFFVQARGVFGAVTYRAEKQQVQVLAEKLRELLLLVDETDTIQDTTFQRDPAMALEAPLEPEGRIGAIALAYEESSDAVVVLIQDAEAEEEEPVAPVGGALRLRLRRDQVRAFVLHALAVVDEGRPICPLCSLPVDPAGHDCPAGNGHRPPG